MRRLALIAGIDSCLGCVGAEGRFRDRRTDRSLEIGEVRGFSATPGFVRNRCPLFGSSRQALWVESSKMSRLSRRCGSVRYVMSSGRQRGERTAVRRIATDGKMNATEVPDGGPGHELTLAAVS